jgi:hypothetical protein
MSSWAAVIPSVQRWDWVNKKSLPLPRKKLFYWSVRYSAYSSAMAFSRATEALEGAFTKGVPVFSNFSAFHDTVSTHNRIAVAVAADRAHRTCNRQLSRPELHAQVIRVVIEPIQFRLI